MSEKFRERETERENSLQQVKISSRSKLRVGTASDPSRATEELYSILPAVERSIPVFTNAFVLSLHLAGTSNRV